MHWSDAGLDKEIRFLDNLRGKPFHDIKHWVLWIFLGGGGEIMHPYIVNFVGLMNKCPYPGNHS